MRCVVRVRDCYLEWSTTIRGPISTGTPRAVIDQIIREELDWLAQREIFERLAHLDRQGSSYPGMTGAELIQGNHAGPSGSELTEEEIYQVYCLGAEIRGGWRIGDLE